MGGIVTLPPPSGVTAGTYGDATHVAQVTIGTDGRVTAASSVAISGGGGSGLDEVAVAYWGAI